jgi:outer membrane protein
MAVQPASSGRKQKVDKNVESTEVRTPIDVRKAAPGTTKPARFPLLSTKATNAARLLLNLNGNCMIRWGCIHVHRPVMIIFQGEPMRSTINFPQKKGQYHLSDKMNGMAGGKFSFLLLLAIVLVVAPGYAQTADQGQALSLDSAIDLALRNQPTITAGRYTVRATEARIGEALSSYYPQLSGSASYSRISPASSSTSSSRTATGSAAAAAAATSTPGSYDNYAANAGVNQLVYDFGKTATQVRIGRLNTESARFDLTNTQETVILNVKQAYYNVLQAVRNRDVVRQSVNQFQQHLDQARGFYEVGTKAKFDVTKAEVDLSNARVNLITAENQIRQAYVTLKNAIGIPNAQDYRLENDLLYAKFELPFEQAIEKAYSQRPDLQSITKRKDASKQSINLARKGYFPTLSGNANYQYTGTDFPIRDGWSYGLNLSVPIFNGYLTRYQVAEAQANYGVVEANQQSLRLDIFSQVQQAFLSLRAAEERIRASELGVRQAKENVELATGRYEAGVGGPLEVTDAIVAQGNAEVAYTSALTDYKNAQASIEKAVGEKR